MLRKWPMILAVMLLIVPACQLAPTPAATPRPTPEASPRSPLALVLKAPALGEAVDASPLLQWEGVPAATHYQVTLLDSGSAVILEQDTTQPLFRVAPPLPKGGQYNWSVQAQDATHAVLAELTSQFSVKADLVLVAPANHEAVGNTPLLQWQAYSGAVQYQVSIVDDQASPPQTVVDQVVKDNQYAVSPPLNPGRYSWTVRAKNANQVVLAELNSQFSVKASLEILDPADGAQVGGSPTIRWAPVPGAVEYQMIVVEAGAVPPAVVQDRISRGTQLTIDSPLKPETVYSLTIQARSSEREVLAEATTTFTVYATGSFTDCGSVHVLSAAECQALVTLHQTAGGPGWAGSADWLATNTPCAWPGVTCTEGHVTDLFLASIGMQGSLPAALADLPFLRVLVLRGNQLAGAIPPELGRLEHLVELDLSGNQLSGSLPAELGQLASLQSLSLHSNHLSGELPAAWGKLSALQRLDLGHNALTGAIPAEFGQLQQLQSLRLGYNQLSGSVPAEVAQLKQLSELDVAYNQLSGPLPTPILALANRALWGNQFEGTVRLDGASPAAIEYRGVSFQAAAALGSSVWPEVLPAVPPQESVPFWEPRPETVRFTFAATPDAAAHFPLGAALSNQAQVLIYPAEAYEALDRAIRLQVGALLNLLADRPDTIDGALPLLPLNNANQLLHARLQYLDFANGSGVGYLTQFSMGPSPVNNHELFYTFQGITADRAYYVAAFFPVSLPDLPATGHLSNDDFAKLMANYPGYLADTAAMLAAQRPEAFRPDLAQVDRLIQSLVVH